MSGVEEIPLFGLGTWKIPKEKSQEIVYHAIKECGIRHIDCACDYGNEIEVGRGIQQAIAEGIVKREDLWITSKLWNTYHRREHVLLAAQKSLADLQISHFDLYLIHFPIALKYVPIEERYPPEWIFDPNSANPRIELDEAAPMYKTWEGMEELVEKGLSRFIGVANFSVQLLMDLLTYAKIRPYTNQIELHPYNTQELLVAYCKSYGIRLTAFSPFGSASYIELGMDFGLKKGLLTDPVVGTIAAKHSRSPAQILLRWSIQQNISVIPKSSDPTHLAENVKIYDFELTEDEMRTISGLNKNLRFNNPGIFGAFMGQALPIFD